MLLLPNEHCHLLSEDGSHVVQPEGEKQALIARILHLDRLEVRNMSVPAPRFKFWQIMCASRRLAAFSDSPVLGIFGSIWGCSLGLGTELSSFLPVRHPQTLSSKDHSITSAAYHGIEPSPSSNLLKQSD